MNSLLNFFCMFALTLRILTLLTRIIDEIFHFPPRRNMFSNTLYCIKFLYSQIKPISLWDAWDSSYRFILKNECMSIIYSYTCFIFYVITTRGTWSLKTDVLLTKRKVYWYIGCTILNMVLYIMYLFLFFVYLRIRGAHKITAISLHYQHVPT